MKNLIRLALLGILLCAVIGITFSCSEEEDCSLNARVMLNCDLYTIDEVTGMAVRDTLESLTITALATDSVILNRATEVKELSLPLRYTADSTVLVLHYGSGDETETETESPTDTVILRHVNTPYFLSMDCGYQMKQSLTSVSYSRHVLDSIYIITPEADIYGTKNLKLFY